MTSILFSNTQDIYKPLFQYIYSHVSMFFIEKMIGTPNNYWNENLIIVKWAIQFYLNLVNLSLMELYCVIPSLVLKTS